VGDREVIFHSPLRVKDGHHIGPVRPFFDGIGARTWHDPKTGWWHARHGDREVRFRVGDRRVYCGDRVIILVEPPFLVGGYVYCPLEPFALYFGVRYRWDYGPVYEVYTPYISKDHAIAIASRYLRDIDEYPYDIVYVDAHRNTAPANRYWDALVRGYEPIWDAPMRDCWVVEFVYNGLVPDACKQVFVDARTGEVIGGWQSR